MSKYQVLEDDKPCDAKHHRVDSSWSNSIFDTFEEAQAYANKWLGDVYGPVELALNVPYDFCGFGKGIEIREIK